jgi:GR25 family glycosyltransferase involved in LPS biosynthesis
MHCPYYAERQLIVKKMINQIGYSNILNNLEDFAVIEDWKKKGVWNTSKRCWEFCLSSKATHFLVLQDDLDLCKDFYKTLLNCIQTFPNRMMSLYANRKICEEAKSKDIRWIQINDGTWGQAILFPKELFIKFFEWQTKHLDSEWFQDDMRYSLFCYKTKNYPLCPMPSLVEHSLPSNSSIGNNNKKRIARWFEREKSYLDYDWSNKSMLFSNSISFFNNEWKKYYYE